MTRDESMGSLHEKDFLSEMFWVEAKSFSSRMVTVETACGHRFVLAGSKVVPKGQKIPLQVEAGILSLVGVEPIRVVNMAPPIWGCGGIPNVRAVDWIST